MTISQRELLDRHELAIATALAEYLSTTGVVLTGLLKGDEAAGEPDVVGLVAGKPHGVEIIDAWYSGEDARSTWELVRKLERTGEHGSAAGAGFTSDDLGHPSGDPFVAALQRALDDHGQKHYGIPTWLVLNASGTIAPLHTTEDGPRLVRSLQLPARFSYLGAYVFISPNGSGRSLFFEIPASRR